MRIIIAGGGTAGHINPGIAVAKYIKQKHPEAEILFTGTKNGLETRLVPREGFKLKLITVRGFKRKLSLDNIKTIMELIRGMVQSAEIIRKFKPDIVLGTGGYVCGPVLLMASLMKIPTLIHEQNAFPGITNRILMRFVDIVAISFTESEKFMKAKGKVVFTGNPVRNEMFGKDRRKSREKLGLNRQESLVVVYGGSRGAEKVNREVVNMLKYHFKQGEFKLIFATGNKRYDNIKKLLGGIKHSGVKIIPYIYEMADVLTAADLVVCRAGAMTVSELTAVGTPAILIPSPNVTENHQEYNAEALKKRGASVIIHEKDLNGELLYNQVISLLEDKEQMSKMSKESKKMGITNATGKIYSIIHELIKKKGQWKS